MTAVATVFDESTRRAFATDSKVGLLATRAPGGQPHVTLITTLTARGERGLLWGQFTEGLSKRNVRADPRAGFLVMTLERRIWRGRARWTHAEQSGPEYESFNSRPMFRYNAYFGIHTVHHMELVEVDGPRPLPLGAMLAGGLRCLAARPLAGPGGRRVFNHWTRRHLAALTTVKFLAWLDGEGYPRLLPALPCRPLGAGRLLFAPTVCRRELEALAPGTRVALFALNLQTESVLLRGDFTGWRGRGPARVGVIDVDWVYNSMPPLAGQIYPPLELAPVEAAGENPARKRE